MAKPSTVSCLRSSSTSRSGCPWRQHGHYLDKNPWEFDEDATAFAQELIETDWERAFTKAGLAVLPLHRFLGDKPTNGPKLVTRQCVRELWENVFRELENDYTTKVAIIGNPGIGKSRGLLYGLRLLLGGCTPDGATSAPQNRVVIYECRKDSRVFAFVPPGQDMRENVVNKLVNVYRASLSKFDASECAALQKEGNFYLIDPRRASESSGEEPVTVRANAILACCPDRRHYKEWAKDKCVPLYTSPWTVEELLAAREDIPLKDNTRITGKTLRARFSHCGGVPRFVFGSEMDMAIFKRNQERQIQNFPMIRDVLQGALLEHVQGLENIPTYVFAYQSKPPFTINTLTIKQLSSGAAKGIFLQHYDLMMNLVSSLRPPQVRGFMFEDFVSWLLSEGAGPLGLRSLNSEEWDPNTRAWTAAGPFPLQRRRLQQSDNKASFLKTWGEWKAKETAKVVRAPEGLAAIDYLLSASQGVNAAAARTHRGPPATFYEYLQQVEVEPSDFTVFYFVPGIFYNDFKVTSLRDEVEEAVTNRDLQEKTTPTGDLMGRAKATPKAKMRSKPKVEGRAVRVVKVEVPMSTTSIGFLRAR